MYVCMYVCMYIHTIHTFLSGYIVRQTWKMLHVKPTLFSFLKEPEDVVLSVTGNGNLSN